MFEEIKDDEIEIDLSDLFHIIFKKIWLIIFCFLIGAFVCGFYTKVCITPQYQASSTLYILGNSSGTSIDLSDLQIGSQLTSDYQTLAVSRPVLNKVINELKLETSYEQLKSTISLENPADTRFLKISVKNQDARLATNIANSIAETLMDRVVTVMHTDKPTLSEKAIIPDHPISPSLSKNVALGGLVGAMMMIALIVILYISDDTLKNEDDITKYLRLNTLATFREDKGKKRR